MRVFTFVVLIFVLMSFSLCWAGEASLKEAYSLYFQGKMDDAIDIMKDYVEENPDARVLYFIGYAYYEMKDMEMARKYFDDAYLIDPEFTPIRITEYTEDNS